MKRIKILEWKKISLVVPEKQDIEMWYKWINDIETQAVLWSMYWNIIFKEDEEEFYEIIRKDKNKRMFMIYVNKDKKVIWNIDLMNIDFQHRKATLWIVIFDKDSREKWYWTESIKLILKYWFEVLGLNKVNLKFIDFNSRAKKVYEKIWFKECGRLKEEMFVNWKYHDDIYMEIFARDFLKK